MWGRWGSSRSSMRTSCLRRCDPLEMIALAVPCESFRAEIESAVLTPTKEKKSKADRGYRYVSDAGAAIALQSVRRTGRVSSKRPPVVRAVSAARHRGQHSG